MENSKKGYFTYMLHCSDGSLYTGWTTDVEKRLNIHNAGKGARYTKSRRPVSLAAYWSFNTREEAMRFEAQLKKLPRPQKLSLLASGESSPLSQDGSLP
ncbi:MAG TPA: GIY-YIG nuclease family protein [Oculatellaceae cyanobacterium]|jgi:putative endonuclease